MTKPANQGHPMTDLAQAIDLIADMRTKLQEVLDLTEGVDLSAVAEDAETDALEARRYRFLRITANISWNDYVEYPMLIATDAEREELDQAIDDAIRRSGLQDATPAPSNGKECEALAVLDTYIATCVVGRDFQCADLVQARATITARLEAAEQMAAVADEVLRIDSQPVTGRTISPLLRASADARSRLKAALESYRSAK